MVRDVQRLANYGEERLREEMGGGISELKDAVDYFKDGEEHIKDFELFLKDFELLKVRLRPERKARGKLINEGLRKYEDQKKIVGEYGLDTLEYDAQIWKFMEGVSYPIEVFNPELREKIEAIQEAEAVAGSGR